MDSSLLNYFHSLGFVGCDQEVLRATALKLKALLKSISISSLASQVAVWALLPLTKGLLPLPLANAGYLVLILPSYLQLGSPLGEKHLELSFFSLCLHPNDLGQLKWWQFNYFPSVCKTKGIQIKALKIKLLIVEEPPLDLIQLRKYNGLWYKQSRISLYYRGNKHSAPTESLLGVRHCLGKTITSSGVGLCKLATC